MVVWIEVGGLENHCVGSFRAESHSSSREIGLTCRRLNGEEKGTTEAVPFLRVESDLDYAVARRRLLK